MNGDDIVIYTLVLNYLSACNLVFWGSAPADSFITKTVGVQALFDVLRKIARDAYEAKTISVSYFQNRLKAASGIDFSSDEFRNASGSGRTAIRKAIEVQLFS